MYKLTIYQKDNPNPTEHVVYNYNVANNILCMFFDKEDKKRIWVPINGISFFCSEYIEEEENA